ncbi:MULTISPECIES: hypothetical protein [unclassified Streptococcus]|uniref:hypothetical protein n=1 Tax=unclassified Streptococcus TaxID=2608887 RepID=UPI00359DCD05
MNPFLKYLFVGLAGASFVQVLFGLFQGDVPWLAIFVTFFFLNLAFEKEKISHLGTQYY